MRNQKMIERQTFWPRLFVGLLFSCSLLLLMCVSCSPVSAQVPQAANAYRADLIRSARFVWGMDAPIATMAAQVHQESGWRPAVKSPAGALGIAQFMPATAEWMQQLYPRSLANGDPLNPVWALRAMAQYNKWHEQRITAINECECWAMMLSAYNGGLGWVNRDKKLASASGADPLIWFASVELFNSGRSARNFKENRDYPQKILKRWEPMYVAAGWGNGVCS